MAVVLAEHNFWLPPPIKPNKPHFADPTRGVPPESALGSPQPYNSILDEGRAFQPVRLRAALVTGLGVRCGERLRGKFCVGGRPFGSNLKSSATYTCRKRLWGLPGPFLFWFQRGLAVVTALQRLQNHARLVSEPDLSLTDRPRPS